LKPARINVALPALQLVKAPFHVDQTLFQAIDPAARARLADGRRWQCARLRSTTGKAVGGGRGRRLRW
jgi:hypothetical protein